MTIRGRVKNGVVVLQNPPPLAEGTLVQVTPLPEVAGNSLALIAAMEAEPRLTSEDIAELQRAISAGKRPAAPLDPFGQNAGPN
jgi:hypothetical protein